MSLINEALKKAQRQRTGDALESAPMPGGGERVAKRSQPRSARSMLQLAVAALVLVVISVVVTVYLLNRPSATPVVADAKPVVPAVDLDAPPPVVVPPVIAPLPAAAAPVTEKPATIVPPPATPTSGAKPAPAEARPPAVPAEPKTDATPAPTTAPAPTAKPDERVHAFIDALRITGVRPAGNDSRVLMNERVYRVNDIVDRALGVRLMKVEVDSLTFSDANGATYVKYF